MNKRQKEVISSQFDDEKAVLKSLEKNYTKALADIKQKIKVLQADELTQSKAYQLEFQKQLEKQLSGIVDKLKDNNFNSISEYLNTCYNQSFLGTMYDLQGQGVPLVLPIDQEQVLKAVGKTADDIKLVNKVGVSTGELKKQVLSEIQRGFATQLSYTDIARNISNRGQANMNRSMLIARTEGGRVQSESKMDALHKAKEKGADIVKQWDATLDGNTREAHRELDGQICEVDENFKCSAGTTPYPHGFGDPAQDCNCRCCLLQRARWAVEGETSYQKWNNENGGLIECSGYEDFKEKYLQKLEKGSIFNGEGYNPQDIRRAMAQKSTNFVTTDVNNLEYGYGKAIETVKKEKGFYDIKAHGDYDGVKIFDTPVDANGLAQIILFREDYNGQPIRLLSCNTGKVVDGTCVAQELANLLGVNVKAPNDIILADEKGWLHVGQDRFKKTGKFIIFSPKKI